jgi:hypothetical protein
MNLINKNRREGIITLAEKVENLSKRTENFVENGLENAFREVQTALNATLTHLQASSSLTEYLKHDIVACIQNLEQHAASMMHMSGYIQTLIALLVEKGMITHEEMEGMWNKVARPGLEALKQAQEAEQKPEPPKAG